MNLNKEGLKNVPSPSKNSAQGSFLETAIEKGFVVMTYQNETSEVQSVLVLIPKSWEPVHVSILIF